MSWYRAGSVTVANGSNVVTGAGTDFVANAFVGDAFIGPDGRSYEISQIVSATELRTATNYQAAGGGGQAYAIQPTQNYVRDLALQAGALLNGFGAVRDGVGQGLFGDGSVAAPGMRFAVDQDTGIRRYGENISAVVCGGVDIAIFGPAGTSFSANGSRVAQMVTEGLALDTGKGLLSANFPKETLIPSDGVAGWLWQTDGRILIQYSNGTTKMVLDAAGNLLVGTPSGPCHTIARGNADGIQVLNVSGLTAGSAAFFSGGGAASSGAACAIKVATSSVTGRSINAGGTINASGADYAEYMVKAAGCGIIAPGDVCGVDRDGKLTKTWADAISFVLKSTDPSLVGGDTWAAHLPPRPEQDDEEADAAFASRLAAWEALLEAARICVDRIAFCGQAPCNVTGDFEVGDYIVAAANGGGITAVAVKADDMTLPQYMRRIGKVWAIRDGRAWIDVQHG